MSKAKQPPAVTQRNWVLEMEEAGVVTSMPMQHFVNKMGEQREFTAVELAGILGFRTTDPVYALVDSGSVEYLDRGKHGKRYCIFPRACVLALLKKLCNRPQ